MRLDKCDCEMHSKLVHGMPPTFWLVPNSPYEQNHTIFVGYRIGLNPLAFFFFFSFFFSLSLYSMLSS